MYSTLAIYNLALSRLGGNELSSVNGTGDDSRLAILCNTFFPHVRDLALSMHSWGFAITEQTLALAEKNEIFEKGQFAHMYALPANCLKPIKLLGGGQGYTIPFVVRGNVVCTDAKQARLQYVFRVHDPTQWPAYFADIVIWGLAAELSTAYASDGARQKFCLERQHDALQRGIVADAVSMQPKTIPCAWDLARG